APSVSSENTTPQPNVASGALRSRIVTSCPGSAFFIRSPKYSPAGPPPTTTILMPRSSCQDLGQAIGLGEVRHGREEDQFVAAGFLVPPHELTDRGGGGQVPRGHLLRERPGEGVVVAQVRGAPFEVPLVAQG